jgi:hypothetical protein
MSSAPGVFVLTGPSALIAMQPASFTSEDDFQDLLARFPELLSGDQIDSVNPRRFLLVAREHPIADELGATARWSLDHLFLDQDGVPTLVEIKRGTDTRIRREVVGQMLDYAANAILHSPMEELRERFGARCVASDKNPIEVLSEFLGTDAEPDIFWEKVGANLQASRVRLLFVADRIPPELRKIVEFLNSQMKTTQVLAIELRQFQGGGLSMLAPIVLGQTQEAIDSKSATSAKPRKLWDETRLLERLEAIDEPSRASGAKLVIEWIKAKSDRVVFNDAPCYGCIGAEFKTDSEPCTPVRLWTDGSVQINFVQLARTKAFAETSARLSLLNRLNAIPGVTLKAESLEKQPSFSAAALNADQGVAFFEIMDGVVERLRT